MRIMILGAGYVGTTMAGCLLKDGHSVSLIDPDPEKIDTLKSGKSPIYEPGLNELLSFGLAKNKLSVDHNFDLTLEDQDTIIVCVGTPSNEDGTLNLSYIIDVSVQVANAINSINEVGKPKLIIYRSTLEPNTINDLIIPIYEKIVGKIGIKYEIAFNPEFLRESSAIEDYFSPPKIVIGERIPGVTNNLNGLYSNIESPVFNVDYSTAEIAKMIDNTWHGLKVSFANEIGRLTQALNISTQDVINIFLSDKKLNISSYYLRPGNPFGGSCLPKDIKSINSIIENSKIDAPVISSILASNYSHIEYFISLIQEKLLLIEDPKIIFLGITFKSNSDDLRESPYLIIASKLIKLGFKIKIFDNDLDINSMSSSNLKYLSQYLNNFNNHFIEGPLDNCKLNNFDLILYAKNYHEMIANISNSKIIKLNSIE